MSFREVWRLGANLHCRVDSIEIEDLFDYISRLPKREVLVEIGCLQGRSLFTLAQAMDEHAYIIGIDLPGGKWGEAAYSMKMPGTIEWLGEMGFNAAYIHADSHDKNTYDRLSNILRTIDPPLIDVLIIDGDHSYEGVKQDFGMYHGLVAAKGTIIFHDIADDCPSERDGTEIGVGKFWKELQEDNNLPFPVGFAEIKYEGSRMGYGILQGGLLLS